MDFNAFASMSIFLNPIFALSQSKDWLDNSYAFPISFRTVARHYAKT